METQLTANIIVDWPLGNRLTEPMTLDSEVQALAHAWSIELTPREAEKLGGAVAEHVPPSTQVYVTWLSGSNIALTVEAVRRLRRAGMEPVPHLPARAIANERDLNEILARLAGEAQVRKALVIGGAIARPAGHFDATMQLLQTGMFERHGIVSLGVGAHPEGSPDIPTTALAEALANKNAYARSSGTSIELTTQFCFDADQVTHWERQVRAAGNGLPVAVGLAGLASVTTLLKHARNCGVGNSIGVLAKHASKVLRLASAVEPSDVVLGLARARLTDPGCAISRLHFFPFGAFEATVRYARNLAAGVFEIDPAGRRLVVSR